MTNQLNDVPGLAPRAGVDLAHMRIHGMPHWHTATWELLVVLGFLAIIVGSWRGRMDHRKGLPTRGWAKVIAIAAMLILASSLVNSLFTVADWIGLIAAGALSQATGRQMLLAIVLVQAKCLGFSIGLATAGYIAYVLLPSGTREADHPQPDKGG